MFTRSHLALDAADPLNTNLTTAVRNLGSGNDGDGPRLAPTDRCASLRHPLPA